VCSHTRAHALSRARACVCVCVSVCVSTRARLCVRVCDFSWFLLPHVTYVQPNIGFETGQSPWPQNSPFGTLIIRNFDSHISRIFSFPHVNEITLIPFRTTIAIIMRDAHHPFQKMIDNSAHFKLKLKRWKQSMQAPSRPRKFSLMWLTFVYVFILKCENYMKAHQDPK